MSDLTESRSGYSSKRSSGALAAAIALNGGLVALAIAIPIVVHDPPSIPPLITHWVKLDPVPPKQPEPPKPEQKQVTQPVRDILPPQPDPVRVDRKIDLGTGPVIVMNDFPPVDPVGPDRGTRIDPPPAPLLVKARPDPRYSSAFRPDYPPALRREGLEGSCTVRVTIDESGRVIAVEMVRATNPVFFTETKTQALKAWRFRPATRDGVPVQSQEVMTVQFRLEE